MEARFTEDVKWKANQEARVSIAEEMLSIRQHNGRMDSDYADYLGRTGHYIPDTLSQQVRADILQRRNARAPQAREPDILMVPGQPTGVGTDMKTQTGVYMTSAVPQMTRTGTTHPMQPSVSTGITQTGMTQTSMSIGMSTGVTQTSMSTGMSQAGMSQAGMTSMTMIQADPFAQSYQVATDVTIQAVMEESDKTYDVQLSQPKAFLLEDNSLATHILDTR